jgi:hypothetical protein
MPYKVECPDCGNRYPSRLYYDDEDQLIHCKLCGCKDQRTKFLLTPKEGEQILTQVTNKQLKAIQTADSYKQQLRQLFTSTDDPYKSQIELIENFKETAERTLTGQTITVIKEAIDSLVLDNILTRLTDDQARQLIYSNTEQWCLSHKVNSKPRGYSPIFFKLTSLTQDQQVAEHLEEQEKTEQ